jgi:hypothetical protein
MFPFNPGTACILSKHRHLRNTPSRTDKCVVVKVEAFGGEVSGRSNDHIVHYFTKLLSTGSLEENGPDTFPRLTIFGSLGRELNSIA